MVVRPAFDIQAHVVEGQQGMKAQVATEYFLLGDPDKAWGQGGDAQVDIGGLGAAVVAQAVSQVVAGEQLAVGARRRQDAHAVKFDAQGPGGDAAFGGVGVQGRSGQQQAGSQVLRGAFEHERVNLIVMSDASRRSLGPSQLPCQVCFCVYFLVYQ